jgi:CHASE3 domain sensor protein
VSDEASGEEPSPVIRPPSREELQQLEERARTRLADPEYRQRISATDGLASALVEELPR